MKFEPIYLTGRAIDDYTVTKSPITRTVFGDMCKNFLLIYIVPIGEDAFRALHTDWLTNISLQQQPSRSLVLISGRLDFDSNSLVLLGLDSCAAEFHSTNPA